MQIQIQTLHCQADDILLDEINEKLGKLGKLYERIEKCLVILKKEKSDIKKKFIVEVRLSVPKDDLFASEQSESFGRSLSLVIADLKKQLKRKKEKFDTFERVKPSDRISH